MLTSNIWTQEGLVNETLGEVKDIFYNIGSNWPDVPLYVVTQIDNNMGSPWKNEDPIVVLIIPLSLGRKIQLSIVMA